MANVKICGLQSVEVLKSIYHFPIDYIGLVFAPSKRRVSKEQAAELLAAVRKTGEGAQEHAAPKTVGVFVDPTAEEIAETLRIAPLDVIQLHGGETASFCKQIRDAHGVAIIKAVSIKSESTDDERSLDRVVREMLDGYRGAIDVLLIDTFDPAYIGGSGRTFRWELIPAYADWARSNGIRLFVAGGLTPDNVDELLGRYDVDGVDVSSGVETDGVKDVGKIQTFVERVKHHGQLA